MPLTKSVGKNIDLLQKENKSLKKKRSRRQMLAIAMSAAGKTKKV
jgi:hypothetical protein